ncbi:MAG: choline-sulfatase [Planctomycetota bacterium]|nr:MAG: choline-sulfatase [Planctomycetota bacterium]
MKKKPNVLFIMTDQQRFDTICALGNQKIYTPNLDRLVRRGASFSNAHSACPVCLPARYTIRTGCDSPTTRAFQNRVSDPAKDQAEKIEERCGQYIGKEMKSLGYRTFGIGKFHSSKWDEDLGYDVHLHSEETYSNEDQRKRDNYAKWIRENHSQYIFIENLMGERTEMYYQPQQSQLPAELGVENWAAEQAVEQITIKDDKPYFGLVSFVGPHPPLAPPIPFNRMYNPENMDKPIKTDKNVDFLDEQITYMNQMIWAEDIPDPHVRILKARYYGEISYIDQCLGKILDAVEKQEDADNTVICFFTDHGDNFGDHHAWQKECFFDSCMKIPYLVSWPKEVSGDSRCDALVGLSDLFGIATKAAGQIELREGVDVLGILDKSSGEREIQFGYYGLPGTSLYKIMARTKDWKYIYLANGGRELFFDMKNDPNETINLIDQENEIKNTLKQAALKKTKHPGLIDALDEKSKFLKFDFKERPKGRFRQFDNSREVYDFPEKPEDALLNYKKPTL